MLYGEDMARLQMERKVNKFTDNEPKFLNCLLLIYRESDWLGHCKSVHTTKVLENGERFPMNWNFESIKNNSGPIVAYYLIQVFDETFNLYQIHEVKTCK